MSFYVPFAPTEQRVTVSVREAEALSGLSHTTIFKLMNTGKIASAKVGRRRLINRESLMVLLAGGA